MIISGLKLKNWRNFRSADVRFEQRVFLTGPNAAGKSNFLDVFRFLRDIAKPGGGLQKAVNDRGGISKIRCLAARRNPDIEIDLELAEGLESLDGDKSTSEWRYAIGIKQQARGHRQPYVAYERVWHRGRQL